MRELVLTVLDTTGIQDYVFGTNQLRQNVGASYLVDCATRLWVADALEGRHNVLDLDQPHQMSGERIEDGRLQAEVIYAGGGNAVILFAGLPAAVGFAQRLTTRALLDAPGLQLVLCHVPFDWDAEALGGSRGVMTRAFGELAARKAGRTRSAPLLGLGVTAACPYTGLPAGWVDEREGRGVSTEVAAKLAAVDDANGRLRKLFSFGPYQVPHQMDDLGGGEGKAGYIAVIHTDGNGMGSRVEKIRDAYPSASQNRGYVDKIRGFSDSIRKATLEALQETIDALVGSIDTATYSIGEVKLSGDYLPFRPLVFGGDDVTFICDGRLGLTLTATYLQQMSSKQLDDGAKLHGRAGVAVVKKHYPFARAYDLAEELCDSAKGYIRKQDDQGGVTAMDWHFAVSGLVEPLKAVRKREYEVPIEMPAGKVSTGKLLMRPVRLTAQDRDWRSWATFERITREFRDGEEWKDRRNKVMALRETLREDVEAVGNFLKLYRMPNLPEVPPHETLKTQGWHGDRCAYFDSIEALDFYVPLKGGGA